MIDNVSSRREKTKSALLATAVELLDANQGVGVRMMDIATAAGVSRQALYLHFKSRTDMLVAASHHVDDVLNVGTLYQAVITAETGVERLDRFVEFWADYVPNIYCISKALWSDMDTEPAAKEAWENRVDSLRSGCLTVVLAIDVDGQLDPHWTVGSATDFLVGLLSIRNWEQLTAVNGWTQQEYVERQSHIARRGLLA